MFVVSSTASSRNNNCSGGRRSSSGADEKGSSVSSVAVVEADVVAAKSSSNRVQKHDSDKMIPKPIWDPIPLGEVTKGFDDDPLVANEFLQCVLEDRPPSPDPPLVTTAPPKMIFLEDHHVVLKELGCTTQATRLFKDHTRAIFPRSRAFDLDKLIALQNQCYQCKFFGRRGEAGTSPEVQFWVSRSNATKHPEWTSEPTMVRFDPKKNTPFVPASEECIRHELNTNGGRTPQKRTRKTSQSKMAKTKQPAAATAPPQKKPFQETSLETLQENLQTVTAQWIGRGCDRFDRGLRQEMVEQFWQDWAQEKRLLETHPLVSCPSEVDGYDRLRQSAHDHQLVSMANQLGNAMVAWYQQQRGRSDPEATK